MRTHCTALTLADFLTAIAAAEAANGMDVNAGIYRSRAIEAAAQARELEQLRNHAADLTARLQTVEHALRGV